MLALEHAPQSAPLIIAAVVAVSFAVPVTLLSLALRRRSDAFETFASVGRHLAQADQLLAVDLASERLSPDLSRAFAQLARELNERRATHERYRSTVGEILNGINEGVLAIDFDRRIRLANRRVLQLFQLEQNVDGRHYIEVLRNQTLIAGFDEALRGRDSSTRAVFLVNGQQRQIEIRVVPLSRGSEIAAVALLIDVTQIEKLQSIRREFLADFHHEVRTPLAGLQLAAESLESGPLTQTQTEQLHKIVARQVRRLERLVEEAGQLNEIESGEMVLHRERTNLRSLLTDVAEDFKEAAAQKGITIEVTGEAAEADVDATKIQQVFSNLLDNAIKHSGVTPTVRIELRSEGGAAVVRVIDYGEGIPVDEQTKIFHRFYRVDKSRSQGAEGTGLGLAIAKHLMLRHGGTIAVKSEAGTGAVFEVRFPAVG